MENKNDLDQCPVCEEFGCFEECFDAMYLWYLDNYPEFMACDCERFFRKGESSTKKVS